MSKTKALFGLAILVGLFAVSVSPAAAWFEATNGKSTTGKGTAGLTTFGDEGAKVECEKAEGEWRIQEAKKATGTKEQALTKSGPHLMLHVEKWNNCTAFSFIGAEVKPCDLQLEQTVKGGTTATGTVATECVVKAKGNCELKVAVTKANEGLKEIKLENSGGNGIAKVNVSGITSVATSTGGLGCVGVKSGKNAAGTEAGTVTGEGLKIV